jgi:hypothetical protein
VVLDAALSEVVVSGDLILYGKYSPARPSRIRKGGVEEVWIDTVLVVDRVPEWPSEPLETRRVLIDAEEFAQELTGVENPITTDVWTYNLADGLQGGRHHTTHLPTHRVILGRASLDAESLRAFETSFVPLAEQREDGRWFPPTLRLPTERNSRMAGGSTWQDLANFVTRMAGNCNDSGFVREFDDLNLALDMCAAVLERSGRDQGLVGTVAIPPLVPTPVPQRRGAR